MLKSLILGMNHGISYGSGALKALQNDNFPELDLLVREAIQNSADAALGQDYPSIDVQFNRGSFNPRKLNRHFEDISEVLNRRYPQNEAVFIEVRDEKTSGLTGAVRLSELDPDDHGNYFKLVFDTGKEQTNSTSGEAGGSWGYGKSVYYRVGMGIVIFYTRIKTDAGYETRLIASLIEKEDDKDSILNQVRSQSVGRAWWGKEDPQDSNELLPITDENDIQEILDIFGVNKFSGDKTGTSIIIPYIDEEKLLNGIFPDNCGLSEEEIAMCTFKENITEYISLAVQKWYAPKIFNKTLSEYSSQKWLSVRVNGEPIRNTDMRSIFQLVQELYLTALSENCEGKERYVSELFPYIKCHKIPSNKVEGNVGGAVASVRVFKEEFSDSGIISPYTFMRLFSKSSLNDPIVMFARTPGMVLDYKIDGKWAKGILKPENDNEYIFAFYVPNCDVKIKDNINVREVEGQPLGEYLRKCEKSDHLDWVDKSQVTIISNIQTQVVNKTNQILKEGQEVHVEGMASKLSGRLGRRLLPSVNFGKKSGSGESSGSGSSGGGGSGNNFEFKTNIPALNGNSLRICFEAIFKNNRKDAYIGIFVESETGLVDAGTWKTNIGTRFPIKIKGIEECIVEAKNSSSTLPIEGICSSQQHKIENDYSEVKLEFSGQYGDTAGFYIKNTITNAVVRGVLVLETDNRTYSCTIKESKRSNKEEGVQ